MTVQNLTASIAHFSLWHWRYAETVTDDTHQPYFPLFPPFPRYSTLHILNKQRYRKEGGLALRHMWIVIAIMGLVQVIVSCAAAAANEKNVGGYHSATFAAIWSMFISKYYTSIHLTLLCPITWGILYTFIIIDIIFVVLRFNLLSN